MLEKAGDIISNVDDGCNFGILDFYLDCPHCYHSNNLSTNTAYICKKCGKDLFG